MKQITVTISFLVFFSPIVLAQYSVDWGKYLNDSIPGYDFSNDDESEQLAVDVKNAFSNDESVYVIGRTFARSDASASCENRHLYFGSQDAYLSKYDKCGNLQWMQTLGTDNDSVKDECGDFALCLALDKRAGTNSTVIYLAGYSYINFSPSCSGCKICDGTNSNPAFSCDTGSYCVFQTTKKSYNAAFIAKYDETGKLLRWTYFGGTGGDNYIHGITIYDHNIFITGATDSDSGFLPLTTGKYDSTKAIGGFYGTDAYIGQLDSNLCQLKFFSYLGGPGDDRGHDIKVVQQNNEPLQIFVSGTTDADMANPDYLPLNTYHGGPSDAFISAWQFDSLMHIFKPQWLQYIGGNKEDRGREMAMNNKGEILFTGFTKSKDFISGNGWQYSLLQSFDTSYNGKKDVFITKYSRSGTPVWGTFFGGSDDDLSRGLVTYSQGSGSNATGYIAFAGGTKSVDLPIQNLHPPFQNQLNGDPLKDNKDAFVAILTDPQAPGEMQQLEFASYFGGKKQEWNEVYYHYGPDLGLGGNNELYLTFYTHSKDIQKNITSANYHHNSNSKSDADGFLAKILNATIPNQFDCSDNDFNWKNGFSNESDGDGSPFILYPNPGNGIFSIKYFSAKEVVADLEVIDLFGKTEYQKTMTLLPGNHSFTINLDLPDGMYLLTLTEGTSTHRQKMIIQR